MIEENWNGNGQEKEKTTKVVAGFIFLNSFYARRDRGIIEQVLTKYLPQRFPRGFNCWLLYRIGDSYVARRMHWNWSRAFFGRNLVELAAALEQYYNSEDPEAAYDKRLKQLEVGEEEQEMR